MPESTDGGSVRPLFIFGLAVLAVLLVFLADSFTRRAADAPRPASGIIHPLPDPLPSQVAAAANDLQREIASATGLHAIQLRRKLTELFVSAGRLDHAALQQMTIAEELGEAREWRLAGDYFYGWMRYERGKGRSSTEVARAAIESYQRVLAAEPSNNDVRTDLATAYLGSNEPMKAVAEIRSVLEADSNHIQARYNFGVMLAEIGSTEEALEQFDRVIALTDPSSDSYARAVEARKVVAALPQTRIR